jgi:HSP20 family protein
MARERSKNRDESQSEAVERHQGGELYRRERGPMSSPFGMMRRFADEMDRMFEDFSFPRLGLFGRSGMEFSPQMDIVERDGKLVLHADLPGMSKDDVSVEITNDAVVIEGERKSEHEENQEGVYRSERTYGRFHRVIPLPEGINTENATASFKDGVLEITMDAPPAAKNRRKIEIQGGDKSPKPGQSAA